jgi:hypothetical protein
MSLINIHAGEFEKETAARAEEKQSKKGRGKLSNILPL